MANTPISDFPAASSVNASDVLAGVQDGVTKKFSFAIVLNWLKQQLESMFVPTSRKINGKDLSSDITLDASDVGAVDTADVGVADGVAGLDSNGKVPSNQLPPISSDAADITYDPTTSGASATNVKDALDEAFDDLDGKQDTITASGILKGDGAGGVSAATAGTDYQAPLTIDATPTANSTNPVQSGGVYTDVRTRVPVYGMGKNLLDNAYFVGGGSQLGAGIFPINQIGKTSYSGSVGPSINRWTKLNSTVELESDGIRLTKTNTEVFRQTKSSAFWKSLLGQVVTLSIWGSDGLVWTTFTMPSTLGNWDTTGPVLNNLTVDIYGNSSADGGCYVRLFDTASPNGTSWKLYEVRLELGRQQTIAHQENGVWVKNELPDYETELIKCQTNTASSTDTYANKTLATEQQLAYVESGTTASRSYAVGEYFCWNGLLYRVTTAISSGGTITPGTNCETVTGGGLNQYVMLVYEGTLPSSGGEVNEPAFIGYKEYHLLDFQYLNANNSTYGIGSGGFSNQPFLQYTKGNAGNSCRVRFTINSNTGWNSRPYYVTVLAR